jgi:hypothetical protein
MGHEGVAVTADGHEPDVLGGNDDVVHLRDNAVNRGDAASFARLSPSPS